jgi:D-3-phosphoglycerate dehydrogenase
MRVLVLESMHQDGVNRLRAVAYSVEVALGLERSELLAKVADVEAIVVKSAVRVDIELLDRAKNLRVIGRAGVGTDNIDKEAAAARGIAVLTVAGGNADAAADFTVMQILCLIRNAYKAQQMMATKDFRRDLLMGRDLCALTVGVVGLGYVGQGVARRLRGFGCRLLGLDPELSPKEYSDLGVESVSDIDALIRKVDVLSLHVPLTPATRSLVGAAQLKNARPRLILINTSRGAIVDEVALAYAVKSGHIAAAALDVFDDEPPFDTLPGTHAYDNPLLHVSGIVSTPHMGASTVDAQRNIALNLADKLTAYLDRKR